MKTFNISLIALLFALLAIPAKAAEPVCLNAADLIGKVYGVADPDTQEDACRREAQSRFSTIPVAEDGAEWMSSEDGFLISYEGLSPEVEAMARYDRGQVAGYGYIFYFPYEAYARETANDRECGFCSALLQELSDMGLSLGADTSTDALFDVYSPFSGGDLRLTLREEIENETVSAELPAGAIPADREGRFVLFVSIVPATFTAAR